MTNQPPQQPGSGAWPGAYRQQPYQPSQPGPFGQPGFGQPGIPAPGQPAGPGGFPQPPKKRHTGLIIGLVIGLIVVLGGGSTGLYFALSGNGDSTNTNTAKGGSSSTNATPPVDLTTVDPCGFVTVSSFDGRAQRASQTKQSEVRITPLSYTECEIDVTLPAKAGVVDVDIQLLSIPVLRTQIDPSDYNKTTQGKLTIYKPKATGKQSCQEGVELPGQYGVTIDAEPDDSDSPANADYCDLANIASNGVIGSINQGLKHLPSYPANSAGSLNACSLLDVPTVSRTLSKSDFSTNAWPGNHECVISEGDDLYTSNAGALIYTLLIDQRLQATSDGSFTKSTVAGRDTFFRQEPGDSGDPSQCTAMTAVHDWKPWSGSINDPDSSSKELIEYESILVISDGDADKVCGMAKQLAATVWPKLPVSS